jgi:hypothetical protein
MVEANGRNLLQTKPLRCLHPTMPGNDFKIGIYQDRDVEAECRNASRDLTNLSRTVLPRVRWVEF